MKRLVIRGGTCLTPDGPQHADVSILEGQIERVATELPEQLTADADVFDASEMVISPGFIDLQINGAFGIDLQTNPELVWELGEKLPRTGVTSFLPTMITSDGANVVELCRHLTKQPTGYQGAIPLGAHFEGPMIHTNRLGAHDQQWMAKPDLDLIGAWERSTVRMVTLAPELDNATSIISELTSRGIAVSAGHSDATLEQAKAGFDAGVVMVTHLFNAMAPLDHRSPNLVGFALSNNQLAVSVIVDGVHLHPTTIDVVWKLKGREKTVLVTDAVSAAGSKPGAHNFAGENIHSDGRRVINEQGNLAGSVLTMDQAIANLCNYTGCDVLDAVTAASSTPARIIGEPDRGSIRPLMIADLTLFNEQLDIQATFCSGELVYTASDVDRRLDRQ